MAKVKIKFTEDQIKLIRNLRINPLDNKYHVTATNNKQDVQKVNNLKYNITAETDMGTQIISQINIEQNAGFENEMVGIDTTNMWGGTFIFEDMAYILGLMDKFIPGTEENPLGPQYEEETMKYLMETAEWIVDHLKDIEEILHQFCTEGIRTDVTYVRNNNSDIWNKEE